MEVMGDKRACFIRDAEDAKKKAKQNLLTLADCADKDKYDYDPAEVEDMFAEIEKQLKEAKGKFFGGI